MLYSFSCYTHFRVFVLPVLHNFPCYRESLVQPPTSNVLILFFSPASRSLPYTASLIPLLLRHHVFRLLLASHHSSVSIQLHDFAPFFHQTGVTTDFCFLPPIPRLNASVFFAVSALRGIHFTSSTYRSLPAIFCFRFRCFPLIWLSSVFFSRTHTTHALNRGDCSAFN